MKYNEAGVSIGRAKRAKAIIAKHVKSTWGAGVLSEVGSFGGLFELGAGYRNPVLVSSIDGVGTKLIVARMASRYDTIGRDLVNHCVNDILVQGARPLFFLDYVAAGTLEPETAAAIVEGMSAACRDNGCALVGGETAEMPDMYAPGDVDVAGCIVGVVERDEIIDGKGITAGDLVFSLPSTGLHTNGYSLARKVFFDKLKLGVGDHVEALGCTVGEELLKVHASYLERVLAIKEKAEVKALAHITGGGVMDNLPRVLPGNCDARIATGTWEVPPVFEFLRHEGGVDESEMYGVFNMGLGMLVVAGAADKDTVLGVGASGGIRLVGKIVKGRGRVLLE